MKRALSLLLSLIITLSVIAPALTIDISAAQSDATVFKLAKSIQAGKRYIVVSSQYVGAAYAMSGTIYKETHLARTAVTIQHDTADDRYYVEISDNSLMWTATATDDGYFHMTNFASGKYLWAQSNTTDVDEEGTVSVSDEISSDIPECYKWSYSGSGVYNAESFVYKSKTYYTGLRLSGYGYFRNAKAPVGEGSTVYLYEEASLDPYVHIRSKYQNIEENELLDNQALTKRNVCEYETESLFPLAVNFPDNADITYTWTSGNTSVATIDQNGLVTYTGAPGATVITLTATSTDADGNITTATSTTTITVLAEALYSENSFVITENFVAGEYYLIAPSGSAGSSVILSNSSYKASDRTCLSSAACTIKKSSDGTYIECSDANNIWECIESGTSGYFHLKNTATGEYLALIFDENSYRTVATAALDTYDPDAYLIKRALHKDEIFWIYSKLSYTNKSNAMAVNSYGGNSYFCISTSQDPMYIYQKVDKESTIPTVQIRVSEFLGSKDITNVLQNRYNISANDTEQMLRYTTNILNITETVWSVSDESVATIDENGLLTYTGKSGYVTITLTVTGEDKDGNPVNQTVQTTLNVSTENYESPTEDYPQYPHEGSVRINKTASNTAGGWKFQDSGVTEVELAVTGVPLNQSVDVVIVFDHSSSMNSGNKLKDAISDTKEFALQIVNSNPRNRVAIVTFDRYRNNYEGFEDETDDYTTNATSTEDRIITGGGTAAAAFMTLDESDDLAARIDSLQYNATSGTNYDFGLQQCYDILKAAKSDPDANKKQYVVFMSDGQPYGFNKLYLRYESDAPEGLYDAWLMGDETNASLAACLEDTTKYPFAKYFNTNGENWFAEAIKTPEGSTVTGMPELEYYDGYHDGLGATIFTIGYDTGELGSQTTTILTTMASTDDKFYYAESNLQEAYNSILKTIVYAANEAVVTDRMGENFNLQFSSSYTLANGMQTITLNPAPCIEIGSYTLASDGTRSTYNTIEKITFETNANGDLTAAYSNLMGSESIYDVAASKIVGKYVTYDILTETFEWNIGDITRNEIVLKYYAYLEGSAEGEREAGIYETNEYAYIDYLNYIGNECQQTFPVPSKGWLQAAVNYEFYLVNTNGEPVNKDGIVVPFTERVLVGQEQTKELLLNSAYEYTAYTLVASEELPDGYQLFNDSTSYKIAVSSGDNPDSAIINDVGQSVTTTYFRDGTITYTGNGEVPDVKDYTNTHVSFAVLYLPGIIPDSIVIDYGLPVKINVLSNDFIKTANGTLNAIGTEVTDGTIINNQSYESSRLVDGSQSITLNNGTVKIENETLIYTPINMTMSDEEVFYYEFVTNNGLYFYTTVTVIPAANIYYEESFFRFNNGTGYTWETAGTTLADKFQAEDRPGTFSFADCDANNVYGRDNAYNDSTTYSLGSAKYTSVDNKSFGNEPTAEFTFCGTGFDLFSVTNNDTGAVLVSIYKTDGSLYKNYIVQTYYGYSYEDDAYVPAPDNGGCLYQVPVISARDLGYDTYKVIVKPLYSKIFDMDYDKTATINSYDIYVDSIRIYDPAGTEPAEDSVVGNAYLEDGEYAPEYLEIRRNILEAETFYSDILGSTDYGKGSIFIDSMNSLDENGISDHYKDAGPNNELYLAKGQAIAFHIVSSTPLTLSSIQLGMKVVYGGSADVVIMNTSELTPSKITVSGAHEMFRRLNSAIIWDQTELENNGVYKTKYPIVIINTSDSIVSLTNFKWAYTFDPENSEEALELAVYSDTPAMALFATRRILESDETQEELEEVPYTDEDISLEWSDTTFTQGNEATLTVTTPYDIVAVTVDGIAITQCEIDENGNKRWIYTFTVEQTGENTFDILLYDNEGNSSQPIKTESITVEKEKTIFDLILDFLKKLITFFRRLME